MTTDGNAIYKDVENIDDLITSLQVVAAKLFKWFSDYEMKGNTDNTTYCKAEMSLLKFIKEIL